MPLILTPDSASVRRAAGGIIVDGQQKVDTLQCGHCQAQWQHEPGSGKRRGFCRLCMRVTCGAPQCLRCVPFEKKIEMREKYGKRVALK